MRRVAILLSVLFLSACSANVENPVIEIVRVYITTTPHPTNTPTETPSPTLTPTSTHTPTPTAIPATISGNPRGYQLLGPTPSFNAPCGLVDTFDFPLDPPHGEDASGGFGFGVYSNRYEKYHAGEDWGFRNAPNLGKPVYSIGHGQVTYAAPNGWGLDRGTVVIRHIYPWGGYVLSFYGHLDPPSVTLKAGECIRRGEKIGEIGNPRTSPHLHFEIRLHLPISAGHGYWSTNPANAGWLPPSQTIWETRLAASPGVLWTRPYEDGLSRGLGAYQSGFVIIQGGEMSAVDPSNGSFLWSQTISETIRTALLDEASSLVYQLDLVGDLTAYPLPGPSEPVWKSDTNALSTADLIPIPDGGVLVSDRRRVIGVSPEGEIRWESETSAAVISWAHYGGRLIFTTSDTEKPLWSANESSISAWDLRISGKLAVSEDGIFLYNEDGLYRLNVQDQTAVLVAKLPGTNLQSIDLVSRSDGGFLLVHTDRADRRLLAVDPDGSLIWERSLAALPRGELRFVSLVEAAYLMNFQTGSTGIQVDLYSINQESKTLTHILVGGSRLSYNRDVWMMPMSTDRILINIGGSAFFAFDPQSALSMISSP
jgi:murein DD-endopeptidase MepM/ murein hydrolase activator NlpD